MATFDEFYKSFPKDQDLRWKFFEREVVPWFLKEDPLFASWISKVWTFEDYPRRWRKKKKDLGTDLVFEDIYGNDWAVQAKCYDPKYYVAKSDIDSFLTDSSRSQIKGRLLILTTNLIGDNALATIEGIEKEVVIFRLDDFRRSRVNYPKKSKNIQEIFRQEPHKPYEFQKKAISKTIKYLASNDRGKLIMACGTGKTLTALWIQEKAKYQKILFLVPSLYLIKQTLTEWINNKTQDFEWKCVCSDPTVNTTLQKDYFNEKNTDICTPITSDINEIRTFLSRQKKQVIFCTYHSLPIIAELYKQKSSPSFDITFADESHRCVGHDKKIFGLILEDDSIKTSKKIFMTATPFSLKDKDKEKAIEKGIDFYSMDDDKIFGEEIFRITFREAINQKPPLLSNYQVCVIAIENDPLIKEQILKRSILTTDGSNEINAEEFATHIALAKGIKEFNLRKIITFHSRNTWAEEFALDHLEILNCLDHESKPSGQINFFNVNGGMKISERERILDNLRGSHKNRRTLISNARCLTEGIDIPSLDCITFVDPRSSEVDIIQAIGRVIRIDDDKDIGTILIPIDLGNCDDLDEKALSTRFSTVWEVVNALKFHDEYLNNQIENLRIELGKRPKPGKKRKGIEIIKYLLPERISPKFIESINTYLIRKTSENWHEMYGQLLQFIEDKGHASPSDKDDKKLSNWCSYQRQEKKKESKFLTSKRIKLLEKLIPDGWSWSVLDSRFESNCQKVEAAIRKNKGVFRLSRLDSKLATWVSRQRSLMKSGELCPGDPRYERLNNIDGFAWEKIDEQPIWVQLIEDFYENNGHLVIPTNTETGKIADMLRQAYKNSAFGITLKEETIKRLKKLEKYGWMWNPTLEVSLEKIKLLGEWCIKNNSFSPPAKLIIEGNNKTYINTTKKEESEKRKFNLYSFIQQIKARYKYTKYELNPCYEKDFKRQNKQIRIISDEEISAIENIRINDGYWYWESFDGYLRVYKECMRQNIDILPNTSVDFDLKNFRNIGRWIQTVHTSNNRKTLERYNFDKLKELSGNHFKDLIKQGLKTQFESHMDEKEWVNLIKKFYKENSHMMVPNNSELGQIVEIIRESYKNNNFNKVNKNIIEELKDLEPLGWVWDVINDVNFEKIRLLKDWCLKNNSVVPMQKDVICEGTNKTYSTAYGTREFDLGAFATALRTRYKYTKYVLDPHYAKDFYNYKKSRLMSNEEIIAVENIKGDDGYWFWEPFDGFLRVYKECFKRNIDIKRSTVVDFDFKKFRNIGRWIQTVHTSNDRGTLERYNFDKLKDLPGNHFKNLLFHQ